MESPGETFQWGNFAVAKFLCRLCLALNNQVNVPIFGEQSDNRQISLKISSCLPVKIAADDLLPKNICGGCLDKLELFYTFWNSSQEAEKKLWAWVQQISINNTSETTNAVAKQITNSEAFGSTAEVKEKTTDGPDIIIINQLFDDDGNVEEKESDEAPSPKRARLSPTVKEDIIISLLSESDDDDENYVDESKSLTRVEDESDMSNSEEEESHSSFVDVRDTNVDEQQSEPSRLGKARVNAPFNLFVKEEIEIVEENLFEKIRQEKEGKEEEHKNAFKQNGERQPKIQCDYYDKTVIREYLIAFHETGTEIGQKGYKCHLCAAIYSRNSHLTVHYRDKHSKHKTKYTCEICGREYFFKNSLKTHIQKHRQKFSCNICPKMYTLKHKLQEHQNIHSKEVEYRCEVCGEIFWLLDTFKNHCNKMHQSAEIVKCDKCHKKFTQNILLNIHKKKYHSKLINY